MIDTYRIDLPGMWQEVPVNQNGYAEWIETLGKQEVWRSLPRIDQRRVEVFLARLGVDLEQTNTSYAAAFVQSVGPDDVIDEDGSPVQADETSDEVPEQVLVATLTVSTIDRSSFGTSVPLSADVVLAAMSLQTPSPDTVHLEPPAVVELPAGEAVRIVRLLDQRTAGADKVFAETFFIPVPPACDRLLVVQFATPNVGDARLFSELFGAIVSTVTMYDESEPVTL
jgi:hypothetical protein